MDSLKIRDKLIKRLNQINDEAFLSEIYDMVREDEVVYKLSSDQKSRIEDAKKEIKENKVVSNKEANARIQKWLKKK